MICSSSAPKATRNPCAAVLIASPPGGLRDGLAALLMSVPGIGTVYEVDDLEGGLTGLSVGRPPIVIVDSDLAEGDIGALVAQAKVEFPDSRLIVLATEVSQRCEATVACAEVVIPKGFPASRLVAVIERLLAP